MCCSLCMFMLVLFYSLYCLLICLCVFFLLIRRPPRSTRTDTLFPYTTLFRSACSRKSDPGGLISGRSPKLDWRPARDPLGLTGRAPYIWGIADVAESGVAHADQNSPRVGNPRIAGHAGERLLQSPRLQSSLAAGGRSEEHTSELPSLMRISYAGFGLKK